MSVPELDQIRMLARVDQIVDRLSRWASSESPWKPGSDCRSVIRRLLSRVDQLRVRLEAPLVVATFGGSGTGKSSLINAIAGAECSAVGRERPTTLRPMLIVHPDTDIDCLGLPAGEFDTHRAATPLLRDIVLVDCPDPDTSEESTSESSLDRLRRLLPHCDVLICTTTQQKYRSARVSDELTEAARGCRLIFVQTHADTDDDIRDDWEALLSPRYDVPEIFRVNSIQALREQQAGRRTTGDLGRLQDLLRSELAASQRIRVRRANLVDLIDSTLDHCRELISAHDPELDELKRALDKQRQQLTATLSVQLRDELLVSRNLWERRLLNTVTEFWGFSPFSSMLRFYCGLGGFIASLTLFRARSSAQMALVGAIQGSRWLQNRSREREADRQLDRIGSFGLSDSELHEAQIVVTGYAQAARLTPSTDDVTSLDSLRNRAAEVEDRFLGDARRRIDTTIESLAGRNSGLFTRLGYETLFLAYLIFILYRVGRNFFWDSFLRDMVLDRQQQTTPLLSMDFYVPAILFFVLWSGLLVMSFTRRLRRGLTRSIRSMSEELARERITQGLFPSLERACRAIDLDRSELQGISTTATELREEIARVTDSLGGVRQPTDEALAVP